MRANHTPVIAGAVLLAILTVSISVLAAPSIPHVFYGKALINGASAPDGTLVTAKIRGVEVAATTTASGEYGKPVGSFYVEDPDSNRAGKTVEFFVNGIKGGEAFFANAEFTLLDLSVTQAAPAAGGGGGGGGGGGRARAAVCTENWTCSDWLPCFNNRQERVCTDQNSCGTAVNKPLEERECFSQPVPASCAVDWSCTDWSPCFAGVQTRTCTDLNNCGSDFNRPESIKACGVHPDTPLGITGLVIGNISLYAPYILLVLIIIAAGVFLAWKRPWIKKQPWQGAASGF
jgi:hypothetical protein